MNRVLALCLAALAVAGCKSRQIAPYVAPRVTGRVLATDTRQPLANVKVIRNEPGKRRGSTEPEKGGAALMNTPVVVHTDREGRFVLDPERVLAPLWGSGWFSVDLVFQCSGYQRFQTNYSLLNLNTNSVQGQSALSTGDILLQPALE